MIDRLCFLIGFLLFSKINYSIYNNISIERTNSQDPFLIVLLPIIIPIFMIVATAVCISIAINIMCFIGIFFPKFIHKQWQ